MGRRLLSAGLKKPSAQGYVVLFVIAACILVLGLNAWPTWQARSLALAEDKIETGNLARSLAEHAHGAIQTADTVLVGVRERLEIDGMQNADRQRLHNLVAGYVRHLPMLHGVFVYDAKGSWVVNALSATPDAALNNSDRLYFQFHRDHPDRGLHVDVPIRSKSNGLWVLPVSRRIDNPDGSFAGVVLATISIDFFQKFYGTFDPGASGAISLASTEGRVVARNPPDERIIGVDLSKGPIFSGLKPGVGEQTFAYRSPIDGIERFGSVSLVEKYPLIVIVSHSKAEALSGWWSSAIRYLTIGCIATASLIFVGMRMVHQVRIRERTEAQYRLLADNSTDAIVSATMEGEPIYASPSFANLTGRRAEDWLGRRWEATVHPEDRAAFAAAMASLRAGANDTKLIFRFLREDGAPVWVEALIRRVPGQAGGEDRLVANIRDITKRKAAEDQVAALNAELAAMAMSDGLTGLPNRRCFDEALKAEWVRAARDGSPVSLIMVDIDRFKLFNDRYGHQQGDACLRGVGQAISAMAKRPGDLAARYGGEELAIILPNTPLAGACDIAERMRREVEATGIEHLGNEPWGVVTASFGLATLIPAPDDAEAGERLIACADAALYRAKRSGRNKIVDAAETVSL